MGTVPVPGGLVTVTCVAESAVMTAAAEPKRTAVASASPVPVTDTVVPPAVLPPSGDTPVTAGSATAYEEDLGKAKPRIVPAAAIPATATAMVVLTAAERRSRERQLRLCGGVFATVLPWTAAGPPDGHSAASSSAASARCDRPRSRQPGP